MEKKLTYQVQKQYSGKFKYIILIQSNNLDLIYNLYESFCSYYHANYDLHTNKVSSLNIFTKTNAEVNKALEDLARLANHQAGINVKEIK